MKEYSDRKNCAGRDDFTVIATLSSLTAAGNTSVRILATSRVLAKGVTPAFDGSLWGWNEECWEVLMRWNRHLKHKVFGLHGEYL